MAGNPAVWLVLDEPVSSLDPVVRLEFMREVMASAARTGLTVIIASHVGC
jgi:ABC-type multidrug transport system ATPase subunit